MVLTGLIISFHIGLWHFFWNKKNVRGTSLVMQWLGLWVPNTGGLSFIPGQGTISHMMQLKDYACLR